MNQRAFGRFAARHQPGLELYCQLMLGCPRGGRAAAQETLLRGWLERDRSTSATCPRIWLYRLATQVCLERTDEFAGAQPFDGVRAE